MRPAQGAADFAAVTALCRAYEASLDITLDYQDFAAELAGLPGAYAPPHGALLLAEASDGKPVGCAALRPLGADGCCEMKRLYVVPEARGTGLGRALIARIVEAAQAIGYVQIRLDTLPSMAAAQAMYRKAGFRQIEPYYEGAAPGTVFLAMRLGETADPRPDR